MEKEEEIEKGKELEEKERRGKGKSEEKKRGLERTRGGAEIYVGKVWSGF